MWSWFRKRRTQEQPAEQLRGAPSRPRTKTYSADTGYVYQYTFRGYRLIHEPESGREYLFSVSRSPASLFSVRIQLRSRAIRDCEARIERTVLDAEQYAIAKLTLFSTFDSVSDLMADSDLVIPPGSDMEMHLRHLGRV